MPPLRFTLLLTVAFVGLAGLARAGSPSDGVIAFNEVMYHPPAGVQAFSSSLLNP